MPQNIERDGGNRIVLLARSLVILTTTFAGALKQKYGATSAIGLLCDAIIALGALLPSADAQVIDYGGDNDVPETDPDNIIGIDASAPAPPAFPE